MDWKKKIGRILSKPPLAEEPLSGHTSLRIGGPAEFLAFPQNIAELQGLLKLADQHSVPLFIIGQGTNLLVSDRGLRGIVVNLGELCPTFEFWDSGLKAGAAVSLYRLCQEAAHRGLEGLEFAAGIPGSLGGALYMNAGAYGSAINELVREVTTIDLQGRCRVRPREELNFAYRWSTFQAEETIILAGTLNLVPGNKNTIGKKIKEIQRDRRSKHPFLPSAGSVFRNPPAKPAGQLIEQVGAKGMTVGDAQVSLEHGNFIVNRGKATAADVLTLIAAVKQKVKDAFGIDLVLEIKIIGENGGEQRRR
ncbi:MAG: UDP-N-acetylmuramate dehydrogenase [Firmicutes bacterium]|nr:UDP-N-acetylmuramate dehydrogenase [Bacillota bacterium]